MIPFLKAIAQGYFERYSDLSEICFLFPNKRSGTFFQNYLREVSQEKALLSPQIITIADFVTEICEDIKSSRIEQLFILYSSYLEVLRLKETDEKDSPVDFESFRKWGEIVLTDFDLVDQYLVDENEIFKNIKEYREIATDFLTEDQKEVLREYFGQTELRESDRFWKHFEDAESSKLKMKFLNLWQVLLPLYNRYKEKLSEKGYVSIGGAYKKAYIKLKENGRDLLPFKKIVTVGFNALSTSEKQIFKLLKKQEGYDGYDKFADFLWDSTGPVMESEDNNAAKFVKSNIEQFPSPDWMTEYLSISDVTEFPEIRIISAPSNVSQVKIAGELLNQLITTKEKNNFNASDVVLVLPDEELLSPALYSLPKEIGEVNLTMGYPFRYTSVSTYISLLRRLYSTTRTDKRGLKIFFCRDLKLFLSHPFSYILFGSHPIEELKKYINNNHIINITLTEINKYLENAEITLNLPDKDSTERDTFAYLYTLMHEIERQMQKVKTNKNGELGKNHIKIYVDYLHILENSLKEYEIKVTPVSIFNLTDRLLSSERINFDGEPLTGIQVMGTLETRSLDFREVLIVSMNEGKMPGRAKTKTFIPESLRKAYGLPPSYYSEEIFAYYFFRLISRAQKVTLIYDSRNSNGARSGESRYLLQLKYFGDRAKIKIENWNFKLDGKKTKESSIVKTEEIKKMLDRFISDDETRQNLSSSSLNTYRECEVRFLYRHLLGLNADPEPTETIDAITIGNILHTMMIKLYMEPEKQNKLLEKPVMITVEKLKKILTNSDEVYEEVARLINKEHYRLDEKDLKRKLTGSSEIIGRQITKQIIEIVKHDLTLAPFELLGCEIDKELKIELKSGRKINFRFAIDRLDRINIDGKKKLRIIDYKTGGKKREAKTFEDIFNGNYKTEQLFQLFTYAWVLNKLGIEGSEDVMTEIYFVPDFIQGKKGLPKIGEEEVTGYGEFKEEFQEGIETMIEDIFSSARFEEAAEQSRCRMCPYIRICNK